MEDDNKLVFNLGSLNCEIGICGEEKCLDFFKTFYGTPKTKNKNTPSFYIGHDVSENFGGYLSLSKIIERGIITNIDYYEKLLNYIYTKNKLVSEKNKIILIESPSTPNEQKKLKAEIFFEKFNIPGLNLISEAECTLYSNGSFTGLVHGSGEGVSYFYPIFDGFIVNEEKNINFGGQDINEFLYSLLEKKNFKLSLDKIETMEIIRDIKEKNCYVALDYKNELSNIEEKKYILPDENEVNIKEERIMSTECLFNQKLWGNLEENFPVLCKDAIQKTPLNMVKDLYNNIFLTGRNTLLQGYKERFLQEMRDIVPDSIREQVNIKGGDRSAWIGGSIFGSLEESEEYMMSKNEYFEKGKEYICEKRKKK